MTDREYMPDVSADLPPGERPMTDAFRAHLATAHVAHFFTELAQHSTADATALTQLTELNA